MWLGFQFGALLRRFLHNGDLHAARSVVSHVSTLANWLQSKALAIFGTRSHVEPDFVSLAFLSSTGDAVELREGS